MALGMKHWIGLTVAGCALVALWLLPPATWATVRTVPVTSVEKRAAELGQDARRTRVALQRLRWSDSLSALALATEHDGLAVSGAPGLVSAPQLDTIRGVLEKEVAGLPARNGDVVVGFFLVPIAAGWQGPHPPLLQSRDVYLGSREGRPYCFTVFATPGPVMNLHDAMSTLWPPIPGEDRVDLLGPCRLVAAYGSPGAGIFRWLKKGGIVYADNTGSPSPFEAYESGLIYGRQIFGWRIGLGRDEAVLGDRCRAGIEKACLSAFLDPAGGNTDPYGDVSTGDTEAAVLPGPAPWSFPASARRPLGAPSEYLLADLEQQFGPGRFQTFWTSPADVPTAFRTAFGRPLGGWLMTWMSDHESMTTAGPGLHGSDVLGVLLVLALAGLVASAWTRGRHVG